jgi:hypothetical protein
MMGEIYRGALLIPDENRNVIQVRFPPLDQNTYVLGPVVFSAATRPACKTWVDGQGWAT